MYLRRYSDPHVYDPSHAESGGVQIGGWVTKYAASSTDKPLYFLTVKGAGHMVPQWKPRATATWLGTKFGKRPEIAAANVAALEFGQTKCQA